MLTVRNTYYMSVYIQFALLLFMLYHQGLVVSPELEILKKAYNLEFFVSIVEFAVYVFIGYNLNTNITTIRYTDWFITTNVLLVALSYLFLYNNYKVEKNTTALASDEYLKDHYFDIFTVIIIFNSLMLMLGYAGEMKIIPKDYGLIGGMVFFVLSFYTIYSNFVKNNFTNFLYLIVFIFIWLLYAVAYLFKYKEKNIAYNLLDLVSKNLFGLFILYVIYHEKSKINN